MSSMADTVDRSRPVWVGSSRVPLPEFLRQTADGLDGAPGVREDLEFVRTAQRFLESGLAAVEKPGRKMWLEYRMAPSPGDAQLNLYAAVSACAREVLPHMAEDFFFMHKSPGLRIRFRLPAGDLEGREAGIHLEAQLEAWQRDGLISRWSHAVYEPEEYLFGGIRSMESVHRLFTADSLAWANYWSERRPGQPAWAFSLLMIQHLFDGLGVVGWEDRDVWDRLRRDAQRVLSGEKPEGWSGVCAKIRSVWGDPERLAAVVGKQGRDSIQEFMDVVADECPRWFTRYFNTADAYVGPRAAAAFLIVYHWNRAKLPFEWQCAIAEALAQ